MNSYRYFVGITVSLISSFLMGCQLSDLNRVVEDPISALKQSINDEETAPVNKSIKPKTNPEPLTDVLGGSLTGSNPGLDFASVIVHAIEGDPAIISRRSEVDAKSASIGYTETKKDFQITSTIYGGIEDITDNTKGVAISLNSSKLLYDGGLVDSQVNIARYSAEAAHYGLIAAIDERARKLGDLWIELEKYQDLHNKISSRLAVLDPLIDQLEKVAKAGIGDVSKVTAAQRTVSTIRVAETNISEGLAQAQLDFINHFGELDSKVGYDYEFVANLLPEEIDDALVQRAPLLKSQYANYKANMAKVEATVAKGQFNVGLEARATRPFAGSGYDSDESIGFVARKTLFNERALESELSEAEAQAATTAAQIRATFREGMRRVKTAEQNIRSMEKAIILARQNAAITAEEIVYLKKQLIIGGSSLESVFSTEARLYEIESKEINFLAEKRKSELTIVSALGLLSRELDL